MCCKILPKFKKKNFFCSQNNKEKYKMNKFFTKTVISIQLSIM